MIGKTILHYKILEKLGEGGMGVVYKTEDTKLERTVALKFLPTSTLVGEEEKKRFKREAKAAAALNHANICHIYAIDEVEDQLFIAMFSLNMMRIALELALTKPIYQDMATKFLEHFFYIAGAMTNSGGEGIDLWDDEGEFYYDTLHCPNGNLIRLKIHSMVGLIPMFAVETLEPHCLEKVPEFKERLEWFLNYRTDLSHLVSRWNEPGSGERRLLSLLRGHRMKMLLKRMLDETEFLSDYGVRALSKYHQEQPYVFHANGDEFKVTYQPGESDTGLFGGNSNWRGPIWFPVNFLIIESLQKFHHYYGDDFKVECPTGSGNYSTILQSCPVRFLQHRKDK